MILQKWSVWLEPSIKYNEDYKKMINYFNMSQSTQLFEPHLTLFGRIRDKPESHFSFFEELTKKQNPIALNALKIEKGLAPWKSLYILFQSNSIIKEFQNLINHRLKQFRDYDFSPHLSLAYGNTNVGQEELDRISVNETIQFSSLSLIYTPDNINNWKLIKRFNFNII